MQLVAYGAQDIYLTGNPQITFFKVVYRRHTNFSMEAIQQTFNGSASASSRVTATISRNGDLVSKLYLENTTGTTGAGNNYGHNMLTSVELEIGGQRIDKHYGHWMEVWSELTEPNPTGSTKAQEAAMDANGFTKFQRMASAGGTTTATVDLGVITVPLQFWFCRNPGLALPLIALQYHEVKVVIDFSASLTGTVNLFADYIYLDTDERRRFAQVSHEYLIEQVQLEEFSQVSGAMTLNFNHPVKELIWAGVSTAAWGAANTAAGKFVDVAGENYHLKLNGHERMAPRDSKYYTRAQVWQHHTGFGGLDGDSIAVYSFALKPEEHQPSGTCNFSRIDNAQLVSSANTPTNGLYVYAVNYNVLRVMSGMGGLAYSN